MEFTSLPIAVGSFIISEWIGLRDLVKLDSACNSLWTRSALMQYCQSGTIKTELIMLKSRKMIQWFISRKLKFRKLCTFSLESQKAVYTLLSQLLTDVGSHVKKISVGPFNSNSATRMCIINAIISRNCLNILKVEIRNLTDVEIAPLFCTWKYIQKLDISDCEITSGNFCNIANMCLNL